MSREDTKSKPSGVFRLCLDMLRSGSDQRQKRALLAQERRWIIYGVAVVVLAVLNSWRDGIAKLIQGLFK